MRRILDQMLDRGDRRRVRMPDRRNDFVRRPAAAERLVERDKAVARKPDNLGTLLFQSELLPFRIENVEEVGQDPGRSARVATFVAWRAASTAISRLRRLCR